jgi:hypothetical protein
VLLLRARRVRPHLRSNRVLSRGMSILRRLYRSTRCLRTLRFKLTELRTMASSRMMVLPLRMMLSVGKIRRTDCHGM